MNIRILIFSLFILISFNKVNGTVHISVPDTTAKPWRMKQSAFIEKYGTNEQTKAFIIRWFSKRFLFTSLSGLSGALTAGQVPLALTAGKPSGEASNIAIGAVLGFALSSIITIVLLIPVFTYSRKKLYQLLEKHKNGEKIPKRFRKQLEERP